MDVPRVTAVLLWSEAVLIMTKYSTVPSPNVSQVQLVVLFVLIATRSKSHDHVRMIVLRLLMGYSFNSAVLPWNGRPEMPLKVMGFKL
jgi:hypothetical protein